MKIKKTYSSGYSLAELLVTISIMGLVAGLASPVIVGMQYRKELTGQILTVESLIKKTKNYAMTGRTSELAGGVPSHGYGVNFSSTNQITLFVNSINGEEYVFDPGEEYGTVSSDDIIELNTNTIVHHFTNSTGAVIPSSYGANIIFKAPNGMMELTDNRGGGANSFDTEMNVFIKQNDINTCYILHANKTTGRFFKELIDC
jgi:prepilin-type N-terminal cleavage/methylation domain-containing protein